MKYWWGSSRAVNGYPLQYSGLEISVDCIVYGVAKSRTWLSKFHFTSSRARLRQCHHDHPLSSATPGPGTSKWRTGEGWHCSRPRTPGNWSFASTWKSRGFRSRERAQTLLHVLLDTVVIFLKEKPVILWKGINGFLTLDLIFMCNFLYSWNEKKMEQRWSFVNNKALSSKVRK